MMTTREEATENIINLFNKAGESAGWKPGVGNPLVINYMTHFYHHAIEYFLNRSGQYLTNEASREAAIQLAKNEAFKDAAKVCGDIFTQLGALSEKSVANSCAAAILDLVKE